MAGAATPFATGVIVILIIRQVDITIFAGLERNGLAERSPVIAAHRPRRAARLAASGPLVGSENPDTIQFM